MALLYMWVELNLGRAGVEWKGSFSFLRENEVNCVILTFFFLTLATISGFL